MTRVRLSATAIYERAPQTHVADILSLVLHRFNLCVLLHAHYCAFPYQKHTSPSAVSFSLPRAPYVVLFHVLCRGTQTRAPPSSRVHDQCRPKRARAQSTFIIVLLLFWLYQPHARSQSEKNKMCKLTSALLRVPYQYVHVTAFNEENIPLHCSRSILKHRFYGN